METCAAFFAGCDSKQARGAPAEALERSVSACQVEAVRAYRHGSITSEMQRSNDIFKKQLEDPVHLHILRLSGD